MRRNLKVRCQFFRRVLMPKSNLVNALACVAISFSLVQIANARAVDTSYPPETMGVWFVDNPEGRQQCRDYKKILKTSKSDWDVISGHLVDSTVISPRLIHEYSEYGEGNFYLAYSPATRTGRQSWRMAAWLGIDAIADGPDAKPVDVTMKLKDGRLHLRYQDQHSDNANSGAHSALRRCADVPEGMYRSVPV
jgi:hypothetical protein